MIIPPLHWNEEKGRVDLLDQTRLPVEEVWMPIETPEAMADAIRRLCVRGAPAIGIAAAYGVVLGLNGVGTDEAPDVVRRTIELLAATRPTAVNLFWALERMRGVADAMPDAPVAELRGRLLEEAHAINRDDLEAGRMLGLHGLSLVESGMTILTHCNAGGLATSGYGTALAPLLLSKENGVSLSAFADETRPLLQGSRITAWELKKASVPVTVITDSMAGHVMQSGKVDAVFVGADRIAANGDVANKIGTYSLAVLARAHNIPFYVFVPLSTFDPDTPTGEEIVIEQRASQEVSNGFGRQTAPDGVSVYNPAFDVTPAEFVTAIVTERGVHRPPYSRSLAVALAEIQDLAV